MEHSTGCRHLPEDVVTEILLRLPVKSLVRCRCVSKRWISLITNPRFISMHLTRVKNCVDDYHYSCRGCVVSLDEYDWRHGEDYCHPDFSYDILKLYLGVWIPHKYPTSYGRDATRYSIVGYYDGIFCLSWMHLRREDSLLRSFGGPFIALCNPAIRELRVLPLSPTDFPPYRQGALVDIGFGYDSKTKDYKVVKIVSFWDPQGLDCVDVYSMRSRSWRTVSIRGDHLVKNVMPPTSKHGQSTGIYTAPGVLHWTMCNILVSFHMDGDSFRVTKLPSYEHDAVLSVLDDKPALVSYRMAESTRIEIYKMNNYEGDSWSLVSIAETLSICALPMGFWTKNLLLIHDWEENVPFLYDIVTKKRMDLTGEEDFFYRETLISVKPASD